MYIPVLVFPDRCFLNEAPRSRRKDNLLGQKEIHFSSITLSLYATFTLKHVIGNTNSGISVILYLLNTISDVRFFINSAYLLPNVNNYNIWLLIDTKQELLRIEETNHKAKKTVSIIRVTRVFDSQGRDRLVRPWRHLSMTFQYIYPQRLIIGDAYHGHGSFHYFTCRSECD